MTADGKVALAGVENLGIHIGWQRGRGPDLRGLSPAKLLHLLLGPAMAAATSTD